MSAKPWHIPGATSGSDPPGLESALRLLHEGRPGPPSEADRPPPSTFPMTKAARAAIRMYRGRMR